MFWLKHLQYVNKSTFNNWMISWRGLKQIKVKKQKETYSGHSYFTTPKGRTVSFCLLSISSFGIIQLTLLGPNGFLIDHVKDFFQHFSGENHTAIRPKLQQLIKETMEDMALSNDEKMATKFIIANVDENPNSFGYYHGNFYNRVLILLPQFFNHEREEDLDRKSNLEASPVTLDFAENSEEYKKFCTTLMLSDEAKKFGVAREIRRSSVGFFRIQAAFGLVVTGSGFILSKLTNTRLNLIRGPLYFRMINYLAVALTHSLMFIHGSTVLKIAADKEVDEYVCRINKSYAAGGVEFYYKEMARHLYLRQSLKNKNYFDQNGDKEKLVFFLPVFPLSERIARCKHIMALHDADLT